MNRAEERVLAWALADAAAPFLTAEVRVGVNAKIGAEELDGAIVDVLTLLGRAGATISRIWPLNYRCGWPVTWGRRSKRSFVGW